MSHSKVWGVFSKATEAGVFLNFSDAPSVPTEPKGFIYTNFSLTKTFFHHFENDMTCQVSKKVSGKLGYVFDGTSVQMKNDNAVLAKMRGIRSF